MKLTRKLSLKEWETLQKIKERFKIFVAKSLHKKGKSTHPMNIVEVPGVQTVDEVIFKTKTKL